MKKIVLLTFALILFSTAVVVRFISPVVSYPTETELPLEVGLPVHNVDSGENFSTIQEAINDDETSGGHTILVDAGTYYEHVTVSKPLVLVGEDKATTIIDGNGAGTVVSVTADSVVINGFTMRNSGKNGYWSFLAGIYLHSGSNEITGNVLMNNNYGIIIESYLMTPGENMIINNNVQNNNYGIYGGGKKNVISNNTVTGNPREGIWLIGLWGNDSNTITGNIVSNSQNGISLQEAIPLGGTSSSELRHNVLQGSSKLQSPPPTNNTISDNMVTDCGHGIDIRGCDGNTVTGNTITNNEYGIWLYESSNNKFYHNNIIDNAQQVYFYESGYANVWDDGYPSGGNYWSNYAGIDSDHDGIGDSPHVLDTNSQDNFPLMGMFYDFPLIYPSGYDHVTIISNSTASNFDWGLVLPRGPIFLGFNVDGSDDTVGFCRVMISRAFIEGPYTVHVDEEEVEANELPISNSTHAFLYFTYTHPRHRVEIVPEFPTWASMLLILIVLTVAIAICKRRLLKTPIH